MADLLNKEQLLDLAGDDFDSFLPIIDDFLENGTSLIARIAEARENNDLADIRAAAHQLKGSSGMLGFQKLYEECKEIEELELREVDEGIIDRMKSSCLNSVEAARSLLS